MPYVFLSVPGLLRDPPYPSVVSTTFADMGRPSHIRRRVGLPAVPKDGWLEGFAGGEDADHEDDVENDEDSGTEVRL
jgi:hypothetical protein